MPILDKSSFDAVPVWLEICKQYLQRNDSIQLISKIDCKRLSHQELSSSSHLSTEKSNNR